MRRAPSRSPIPRVEQPSVKRYYLAPSATTAKPGESEALDVLANVLGSGSNSRLYRTLVVDKGIALNAGAFYPSTALDYGKFGVYGVAEARRDAARRSKTASTPCSPTSSSTASPPTSSTAPRPG